MADETAVKYHQALAVVGEYQGMLPDDTYLERLITETASGIRDADDDAFLFETWGLRAFVRRALASDGAADVATPMHDFCMSVLARCAEADDRVAVEATALAERLLAATTPDSAALLLRGASPAPLDMLKTLLELNPSEWGAEIALWDRLLLPLWEGGGGGGHAQRSMFWRRSLNTLTQSYLAGLFDGNVVGGGGHARSVLAKLASFETAGAQAVVVAFLRSLLETKMEASRRASLLELLSPLKPASVAPTSATSEAHLLYLALADPVSLVVSLAKCIADCPAESVGSLNTICRSVCFLSRRDFVDVGPVLDVLLSAMATDLEDGKLFRKSLMVVKRCRSAFVDIRRQEDFIRQVGRTISAFENGDGGEPEHEMSDSNGRKLLDACLTAYEEGLESGFGDAGDRRKDWDRFVALCLQSNVADGPKMQTLRIMSTLVLAWPDRAPMDELLATLWPLARGRHWGVEDAFLHLLARCLDSCDDVGGEAAISLVQNVAVGGLASLNSFLRAGAFVVLQSMLKHDRLWADFAQFDATSVVESFVFRETEAIVRRNAARFVDRYFHANPHSLTPAIRERMGLALFDLDCETRENVLLFWHRLVDELLSSKCPDGELIERMDALQISGALAVAVQDYDVRLVEKLFPLVAAVAKRLPKIPTSTPTSRKRASDVSVDLLRNGNNGDGDHADRDEVIGSLVDTSDRAIVQQAAAAASADDRNRVVAVERRLLRPTARELVDALEVFLARHASSSVANSSRMQIGLDAVLDDIVQCVSEGSKIDGKDCV